MADRPDASLHAADQPASSVRYDRATPSWRAMCLGLMPVTCIARIALTWTAPITIADGPMTFGVPPLRLCRIQPTGIKVPRQAHPCDKMHLSEAPDTIAR